MVAKLHWGEPQSPGTRENIMKVSEDKEEDIYSRIICSRSIGRCHNLPCDSRQVGGISGHIRQPVYVILLEDTG